MNRYLSGHLCFDDERYFYTQRLDRGGCELALLGLNSAFLWVDDNDKDKLALGERSVHPALEQAKDAKFRLALLHHSFE